MVSSFLLKSQNTVLSKTNRSELIDDLNDYVLKLAIALYNRQGNEGLASYSEGGESESYQSEDEISFRYFQLSLISYGKEIER